MCKIGYYKGILQRKKKNILMTDYGRLEQHTKNIIFVQTPAKHGK